MSLRDDLTSMAADSVRYGCNVARIIGEVTTREGSDVADQIAHLINETPVGGHRLLRTLRANGYRLASESLHLHRRGECSCHEPR